MDTCTANQAAPHTVARIMEPTMTKSPSTSPTNVAKAPNINAEEYDSSYSSYTTPPDSNTLGACPYCESVGWLGHKCENCADAGLMYEANDGAIFQSKRAKYKDRDTKSDTRDNYLMDTKPSSSDIKDEYHLHIRKGGGIPKTWALLDSCFTVNIFSNPDLLENIHKVGRKMRLHCQSGSNTTDLMGTYPRYPEPV